MIPKYSVIKSDGYSNTLVHNWLYDPVEDRYVPQEPTEATDRYEYIAKDVNIVCPPPPYTKGDYISPQPWSYTVDKTSQDGSSTFRTYYPDGRPNAVFSASGGGNLSFANVPNVDTNDDQIYNELVEKLYKKIRGDLDLSVGAFQARQTAQMFKVTEQFDNFVRRKSNIIKKAGSAWLQLQYGWKPLLSDIYSAADESVRYQENSNQKFRVRHKAIENDQNTLRETLPDNRSEYRRTEVSVETKFEIGARFVGLANTNPARWASLNPLSIGWELLPYSFVVDWFLDVGGYLRSAETAVLYANNFQSGYISKLKHRRVRSVASISQSSPLRFESSNARSEYSRVEFTRTLLGSTPFPLPPQLDAKLGAGRLLNSAALLSQFLGRGK